MEIDAELRVQIKYWTQVFIEILKSEEQEGGVKLLQTDLAKSLNVTPRAVSMWMTPKIVDFDSKAVQLYEVVKKKEKKRQLIQKLSTGPLAEPFTIPSKRHFLQLGLARVRLDEIDPSVRSSLNKETLRKFAFASAFLPLAAALPVVGIAGAAAVVGLGSIAEGLRRKKKSEKLKKGLETLFSYGERTPWSTIIETVEEVSEAFYR